MNTWQKATAGVAVAGAIGALVIRSAMTPPPPPAFTIRWMDPDTNVVAIEFWHTLDLRQPFTLLVTVPYDPPDPASYDFPETNQQEFFIFRAVDDDGQASAWCTNRWK